MFSIDNYTQNFSQKINIQKAWVLWKTLWVNEDVLKFEGVT